MRELAERLTSSNSDLAFQVSMGPKFFQSMDEIILLLVWNLTDSLPDTLLFVLQLSSPAVCRPSSLFSSLTAAS